MSSSAFPAAPGRSAARWAAFLFSVKNAVIPSVGTFKSPKKKFGPNRPHCGRSLEALLRQYKQRMLESSAVF
jgi:hypothetical protein